MKTQYYVCGLGYDENANVTDYGIGFGYFDTYEEAYELFVKLQCRSPQSFFEHHDDVYEFYIRLEECEVTDDAVDCIDVRNEWSIMNPKYEEV